VPLWVRHDNLKTAVAQGVGSTAVFNHTFARFALACGFGLDPCRPSMGAAQPVPDNNGVASIDHSWKAEMVAS
jgi:hypothetical protein